jgi:tRNA pseudouridine13 synthase
MRIKEKPEDFIVEEICPEKFVLKLGLKYKFKEKYVCIPGEGALIFVLEKKNWDTIGAMKEIAKRLQISQKRMGFAGTKDRRAITSQRCSALNVKKERLEALNIKDMKLSPLSFGAEVKLGDLTGNRFTIIVKDINPETPLPKTILNYFGEQRFGTLRPITHLVGKAIVEERMKEAVDIYLFKWFETELEEDKNIRQRLEKEKDYIAALKYYPKRLIYERTLLGHLAQKPGDYAGALRALPKKLLLMFVHAYQSHLFNRVLNKRKEIGFASVDGDILQNNIPTGPLYGYESVLADGKQGEIEREVLEEEWLELDEFKLHKMPELSSKGLRRPMIMGIKDFKVIDKGTDWMKLQFSLPKGCYATTVLHQMFD